MIGGRHWVSATLIINHGGFQNNNYGAYKGLYIGGDNIHVSPLYNLKTLELYYYGVARDTKESKNLLFDIKYLRVTRSYKRDKSVHHEYASERGCKALMAHLMRFWYYQVDTWENMKWELQTQFLTENIKFVVWWKLRQLYHITSICDYFK